MLDNAKILFLQKFLDSTSNEKSARQEHQGKTRVVCYTSAVQCDLAT